ncbi:MAG: hydantoinase B/oxoprolinase family protein [Chloroflexota bacterium]
MTLDPVTLELIRNGLQSVVDEMALTLVRTAYSANLKSAMDLSSALCDARGRLVAQGLTLPLHMGAVPDAMEAFLATYADSLQPGDAFVLNDPYEGGTHLPDFFVMQPVFLQAQLLGFSVTVAHHTDVGGRVPGGNGYDSTEIFQEGFRIPPLRLCTRGQIDPMFMRLLACNVRIPTKVLGDLRAQLAACHIGERGLLEVVERYRADRVVAAFDELLDYTERLTRAEIGRLPEGQYAFSDYLDGDGVDSGPICIHVTVTVTEKALDVDFAGSSPQVKGAINCVLSFTKSAVYACVRCLMPSNMPNNEGYFRAVRVHAPPGTIVNPLPPAAVAARGLTGYRVADAVMGALAQIAPDRVPACESGGDTGISLGGRDEAGQPFVFLEFLVCSRGGRPDADGTDGVSSIVVNFSNYPVEVIEREYPLRIEEYGYLANTGGPGRFRGGLALVRQYRFLQGDGALQIRADRQEHLAYGLAGGQPGTPSRSVFNPGHAARILPSKVSLTVRRGDVLRHELAGAGGWGPPLEREPAAVLADVLQEKLTVEHAREAYGVVIDPISMAIDLAATQRLRESAGHASTPIPRSETKQD